MSRQIDPGLLVWCYLPDLEADVGCLCAARRGNGVFAISSACHRRRRIAASWWTLRGAHRDKFVDQVNGDLQEFVRSIEKAAWEVR
jgi:hypothetical protein